MSGFIDVEHLQKLTFERSTSWASFIEKVAENGCDEEIDLEDMEDLLGDENGNDDYKDLASMEDDDFVEEPVDLDVLRYASNASHLSLYSNKGTVDLPVSNRSNENNQLVDIINETLPVINEHNRQLKEFGLDKVLISFDKRKIEEKVGNWLNRHNSLYGGENILLHEVAKNTNLDRDRELQVKRSLKSSKFGDSKALNRMEENGDSDDSLQSGETARYIRSSRSGCKKNTTTTMIKTYRAGKRNREALREKYGFQLEDDGHNLEDVRCRKELKHDMEYWEHYGITKYERPCKSERLAISTKSHRRKVLRKRICSNSYDRNYSSSDSEYCYEDYGESHHLNLKSCCLSSQRFAANYYNTPLSCMSKAFTNLKSQSTAMKMSLKRLNRKYGCSHSGSKSYSLSSSSSTSTGSVKRRPSKINSHFCKDKRLRKRESECRCYESKKLCKKFKHVADTSTEEWYVENCHTPKKLFRTPKIKTVSIKPSKSVSCASKKFLPVTELKEENVATRSCVKEITKVNTNGERKSKISKIKPISLVESSDDDEIVDFRLRNDINKSNILHENKRKDKGNKLNTEENLKKYLIKPNIPVQKTVKRHKEVTKLRNNKANKLVDTDTESSEQSDNEAEIMNSTKLVKVDETFFASTQAQGICNSTALSTESQAYRRQFTDKQFDEEEEVESETSGNKTVIDLRQSGALKSCKTLEEKISKSNENNLNTLPSSDAQTSAVVCNKERASKRESERRYTKDTKLSNEIKHLKETSTHEWHDENISSHVKTNKENRKINSKKAKQSETVEKFSEQDTCKSDELYELELQQAIKASKDHYENEQKRKQSKSVTDENNKKHKIKSERPLKKPLKRTKSKNKKVSDKAKKESNEHSDNYMELVDLKKAVQKTPEKKSRACNDKQADEAHEVGSEISQNIGLNISPTTSYKTKVTSTTLRSTDADLTPILCQTEVKQVGKKSDTNCDENSDCVSSTTCIPEDPNGILIYDPEYQNNFPANSLSSDGYFTVTKDHLSAIIGERAAEKFFKYYVGRRRFKSYQKVYYIPPNTDSLNRDISSSSESVDDLDNIGLYGELYATIR